MQELITIKFWTGWDVADLQLKGFSLSRSLSCVAGEVAVTDGLRYLQHETIAYHQKLMAESERDPSRYEVRHQMPQRSLADKPAKPPSGQALALLLPTTAIPRHSAHMNDLERPAIGKTTAIRRLLENSSLPVEEVSRLVAAYERTLRTLDLVDRHDPVTEIVAKKVIEIGKRGGDPSEISKLAVKELGIK